jgi:hypothetical protein
METIMSSKLSRCLRALPLTIAVLAAGPAFAAPYAFTATLAVQVGALPPVTGAGSGSGTSAGVGGAASIPAGVFSLHSTAPIDPPLLVIDGFAVGAAGIPAGATVPVPAGTNKALAFGGVTGIMGLDASAYLLTGVAASPPGFVAAAIPLFMVGNPGPIPFAFNALGMLIMGTIFANPYQLGMVTVMGALNGSPSTVMGTGFDNRTAGGVGTLQLVSPTSVGLGALGALASLATLTITFVPEPGTLALLGIGLAAIGAAGRGKSAG